ncbi:MAG: hypothetical protein Unbinned2299contig1001_9 [Prokaryotic dsDNA virus sp.]|nr:MAG: hypothetical protein Unbinned2299contig1001_9 [Prokaryotic dsDNA virus sp.]|tara:strand:+ start:7798 stop:8235 length:438 start_codon:yes stop_codon:yes gene_type:complete
MIWLLPFLIPWSSDSYSIDMGSGRPVVGFPIELTERPNERMMMMSVGDFIRAKQKIEGSPDFCRSAINSAVGECERGSIEAQREALADAEATRVNQEALIKTLQSQLTDTQIELSTSQENTKVWQWVSVGVGAAALSTTAILIFK